MPALLQLVPTTVATTPGAEAEAHVFVGNTGGADAHFSVVLEGEPAGWAEVEPAEVTVSPGHEREVRIVFRLPRGAPGGTGDIPFDVVVRNLDDGRVERTAGVLEVQGEAELSARLVPRIGKGSRTATFKLVLDNSGSTPARVLLTPTPTEGVHVDVTPDSVIVESTEPGHARVVVHPDDVFLTGMPRTHSFEVRVEPLGGATVHAGGVMTQRPLLVDYLPRIVIGLLVVAVLSVGLAVIGGRHDDRDEVATDGPTTTVLAPLRTVPTLAPGATTTVITTTTTAPPGPPPPPVPLDQRRIAFQTSRDGNSEIYVATANGTEAVNVTRSPAHDSEPAWSPDGHRLAFDSDRAGGGFDVFVMNGDGTGVVQLTNTPGPDGYPAWSPDGSHIAFVSFRDGNSEIYVMKSDGSDQRRLTRNLADDGRPTWSPDGTAIAFHSNRSGNSDIWVIGADGKNERDITPGSPATDANPDWSPDGKRIVFDSLRDGDPELYLAAPDGSGVVRLTTVKGRDTWPTWSPDGKRIAFQSDRDGDQDVYTMPGDGRGAAVRLSNTPGPDVEPAWSS